MVNAQFKPKQISNNAQEFPVSSRLFVRFSSIFSSFPKKIYEIEAQIGRSH